MATRNSLSAQTSPGRPPVEVSARVQRRSATRSLGVTAALAVSGLAAGIGAKAVDISPVPDWLHDLGNYPTAYVLALALLAWSSPSIRAAALRAALAFTGMCLGYYLWSSMAAGFLNRESALAWTAVSLTAVPLAAGLLRWVRHRPGVLAGAVLAGVAALLTTDGVLQQMWWVVTGTVQGTSDQLGLWFRPVQVLVQVAGLVLLLGVLPPGRRSRLWALGLFLPLCLLAGRVVFEACSLVPGLG